MVLERIIGKSLLAREPDVALFIGFMFTLIGFITSYVIFITGMSIAMIGFSSILILPYIIKIMRPESSQYKSVFDKDAPTLRFFIFLFLGMALAYTILFGVLRPDIRDIAFETQIEIIGAGSGALTGQFGLPSLFYDIVANNLVIVAVAIILSYFYGSGAIFVLNYNASIAGIVYGSSINALIWGGIPLFGNPILYLPHTVLEIMGYLLAAIAGVVISKPLTVKNRTLIKRDSILLILSAIALIVVGGYVEIIVPFL